MEGKRQEGIRDLPMELQALILLETDAATVPLLRCVGHTWNALLRNRRVRLKVHDSDGADEWYGLRCGIARCACPTGCLVRFATRVSACRRWAVLFWLRDLLALLPPESSNGGGEGEPTYGACETAAMDGDTAQIQILVEKGFRLSPLYVAKKAAKYGHYHVIKWLRATTWISSYALDRALECAAKRGHFEVVKRFHADGCPLAPHIHLSAFKRGDVDMVHWLHEHNCPTSILTCEKMAGSGRLDMLKLARTIGCTWDQDTCADAAANGHLDVLKWARANGCPWGADACEAAARNGHLCVLEWLRANGCPWDAHTLRRAASGGHLGVLRWALTNDCPHYSSMLHAAIHGDHLDVIQWLLANGSSLHELASDLTLAMHQHVTRWAYEQGYIWSDRTIADTLFYTDAVARGDLGTLQWLWSIQPFGRALLCGEAALNGHLHILAWLRAQGCPWDALVIRYAIVGEYWNIVEWARAHGCPEP